MADLSITAANVQPVAGYKFRSEVAGEAITAGEPVYRKAADGKAWLTVDTSAAAADCIGIALHAASADQPVRVQYDGDLDLGATLTVGEIYVVSAAGKIAPEGDLATSDFVTVLGVASAADNLKLCIQATGAQVP